jgi:5-methyltetrahydrofolate--homocysteine methyltransferase
MESIIRSIYDAVLDGDQDQVETTVGQALEAGMAPATILQDGMIAAMQEVGQRFEQGDYFIPEMLISARAMQAGVRLLRPHLVRTSFQPAGKVVIGTVKGDMHDIGKNLVSMMLEGASFEIVDLGTDVPPETFVEAVRDHSPQILALSALLTTTMPSMSAVLQALQSAGLRDQVRVIVGGAPVTPEYALQIGADGYAPDASRAVGLARGLASRA